jgi:hypothetical protein
VLKESGREKSETGQKICVPIDVDHRFPALDFIGREKGLCVSASQCSGKFPSQIVRILDATIHSLSAGGTIDVAGIAGQEDPAQAKVRTGAMGW